MFWLILMLLVIIAGVMGFVYLANRFRKFGYVNTIAKDKKNIRIILGIAPIILMLVIFSIFIGYINAMTIILHLVAFWILCDAVDYIIKKIRKKEPKRYYAGACAILITVVYMTVGWYQAHHVWRTNYTIETEKEIGTLRVVQFADSHIGTTFHAKGFATQMKNIQEENPDVVVITGDYVDDDTSREDMVACCSALGTLKTTYGVYFSLGNHDKGYYGEAYRGFSGDELIAELEKNNVTVLQDESILIDDRFYIIGRQDKSENERGSSRAEMKDLVEGLDSSKVSIVLDHQPSDYLAQTDAKVDLVLSGHTHGGQIFPFIRAGEWIRVNDKTYGHEKREETNFIVTSGISDWALKFKTGCRSEYVVVDIEG